ncbi:MAG: maleylpyruvate isomerase N-terminal domain-containing protein, partial [Microthrixaceae bacterium]
MPTPPIDHPAVVRAEADRFAVAVERGPLDAPVPACPRWDLEGLTLHLGRVHRWARLAAATGTNPDPDRVPGPPEPGEDGVRDRVRLADWVRAGADELADTLATLDPDAPTWHPFPVPQVAGLWPRRQAQETLVHRWDAEAAVGDPGALDATLAADGVDEYLT